MSMTERKRMSISGLLDVLDTGISLSTCHTEYSIQVDVLEDLACCIKELEQYRAIGTVSEFRELKEKATAKSVNQERGFDKCPNCGEVLNDDCGERYKFCPDCGQALEEY